MKKKAILIINNPIDCEHCDLNVPFNKYHLACQKTGFANGGDGSVPSWCPLKPMPQKKEETFAYWIGKGCNDAESYINGFNACLEEITGETE